MWAGRTQAAVEKVFDTLESKPLDAELIGLLQNIQKYEQSGNLYRGYTILEKNDANNNSTAKSKTRIIDHFDSEKRPVVWLFTGMGSQVRVQNSCFFINVYFKQLISVDGNG